VARRRGSQDGTPAAEGISELNPPGRLSRATDLLSSRRSREKDSVELDPLAQFRAEAAESERRMLAGPVDPPAVGEDQRTGPPDFVGVAAQKAGTSWWYRLLVRHPEIVAAPRKELHYFQHHWDSEFDAELIAGYHRYFPRKAGEITGEWTPRYMIDPWTPGRLAAAAPEARILMMLRDPVDRFGSGATHMVARFEALHPRFLVEQFERSRYAPQLDRLLQHFAEEQILILQFEQCVRDPRTQLRKTLEFLGVDPLYSPENIDERRNAGKIPPVSIPSDLRAQLVRDYSDEVRALADRWEQIDLSLWPNFDHLSGR
jgi:hypothetical protein